MGFSKDSQWLLRGGVVSVLLGVLVVLAGCGGGVPSGPPSAAAAIETPQVNLGGYTFGATSNVIVHGYMTVNATTPKWVWRGWGACVGQQMTVAFSNGGLVAGAKTLRVFLTSPGETSLRKEYNWLAQDMQGNVHMLKFQELDDGTGHGSPAKKVGVAAGPKPRIWLPKLPVLVGGYIWYWYDDSGTVRDRRYKVQNMNASARGRTGLMQVQDVEDENGDGVFNPSWSGPDRRQDFYWQTGGAGLYNLTVAGNPAGGFVRR